ncbi:hypothetical protein L195_g060932, partial [Trifolium pratense]
MNARLILLKLRIPRSLSMLLRMEGLPPVPNLPLVLVRIVKTSSAHNAAVEGGNQDSNTATPPSISQEQYDKLMSLLQHSNLAPNSVSASSNQ